jgi:hypothetical protein
MLADLEPRVAEQRITLLETLDRVADVDLIFVGLRLLLSSVETARDLRLGREL